MGYTIGTVAAPGTAVNIEGTVTSATGEQQTILLVRLGLQAATASIRRHALFHTSGGVTPTSQTPEKTTTRSPGADGSFATGWGTQPTTSGSHVVFAEACTRLVDQAEWRPPRPWAALTAQNGEQVSLHNSAQNSQEVRTLLFCPTPEPPPCQTRGRRPRKAGLWHHTGGHYCANRGNTANPSVSGCSPWVARVQDPSVRYDRIRSRALLGVGGIQTSQALTATITSTATIVRSIGKILSSTVTSTATIVKSAGKIISATVTTTASIVKSVGKPLTATVTTTASLVALKAFSQALTATVTSTATIIRSVGKIVSATGTTTASIVKSAGKILSATATTTTSIRRSVGKPLIATATSTASIVKRVGKILSATATSTASLVAVKTQVFQQALTATVTATASVIECIRYLAGVITSAVLSLIGLSGDTLIASTQTPNSLSPGTLTPDSLSPGTLTPDSLKLEDQCAD